MLSLFRRRHFAATQGVVVFASIAFFATTFLLTFYLQGALHQTPLATGLFLLPLSIPQMITAPFGGHLADRIGIARPIVFGLAILAIADWLLSLLGPHLNYALLIIPLALMSVGNGFYWPPLVKGTMQSAPRNAAGAASGMFYTLRNVGFTLSLTLALLSAESSLPAATATKVFLGIENTLSQSSSAALSHSVDITFRLFVICYVVALLFSLLLLKRVGRTPGETHARQAVTIDTQ